MACHIVKPGSEKIAAIEKVVYEYFDAFVLSMPKINAAAWRSRRLHSVSTAFAQRCWRLHSAHLGVLQFLKRCGNAVRTPLWCDGF